MKKSTLAILGLGIILLIASCKKEDVQTNTSTNTVSASASTSQWKSLGWTNSTSANTTTYFSKISDSSITSNVVSGGLVLVFKKNGSAIQSLPVQDNNTYWYYQVSNGSVRVNGDNGSEENVKAQLFSYFVITPEKLSSLQAQGKSKIDLMQLSYDQAVALLK